MASTYFLILIIALCSVIYFNDGVKADCGGVILKTKGTITSPSYPFNYPPNEDCTWEIKLPPGNRIGTNFTEFELEYHNSCEFDSVTFKSKMEDGTIREHGKFCGLQNIPNIVSQSNILLIEFKSDGGSQFNGFEMEFFAVSTECGGLIERSGEVINSPNFPLSYPSGSDCTWTIRAPLNNNIKLTFTHFTIEACGRDYLEFESMMAEGEIEEHGRFCGTKVPRVVFSKNNTLLIHFVSNESISERVQRFRADLSFEGCGGVIRGGRGNISTPFYPDSYPPNKVCEWTILVPPQHKIKLHFLHFDIEGGKGCRNDFLHIQSNSTEGKIHEYGKYCSLLRLGLITSESDLLLRFVSDRSIQRVGFRAEYFIDKFTDFESSTWTRSTAPIDELFYSTVVNQYENISTESTTSSDEEHTFSDEYPSTLSSFMTSSTPVHEPHYSTIENQPKENPLRNETNILSALKVLANTIVSMEEKQDILLSNHENLFDTLKVLAGKVASIEERQIMFFNNFEKSVNVSRLLRMKEVSEEDD